MDLAAYLGTVGALCGLAVGAMYVIVGLLGRRIDDLRDSLGGRIDALAETQSQRFARLESQNDVIIDAVGSLGERVTRLEAQRQ